LFVEAAAGAGLRVLKASLHDTQLAMSLSQRDLMFIILNIQQTIFNIK
jgi:hypothetical protein